MNPNPPGHPHAHAADRALAGVFEARAADWRMGAVVYQVLVDRFAPPFDLPAKRHLYPAPRRLRPWDETPAAGHYLQAERLWSHEIDFWGGDLQSLVSRLDHVQHLGADVLYLNPVFLAATNHKYDTLDHHQVSPEYGTRADVRALADTLHARGMKLVLDGVFNHMGRNAPAFCQAEADPDCATRDWFCFDPALPGGARAWWRAENLPELNLENPQVRRHLWGDESSVVRRWLRDGADGWRLDVAFDIGPVFLQELTDAAHEQKPGSLVVGEIPNYPCDWFPSVDGVMHFTLRNILLQMADGRLDGAVAGRMIERLIADTGIENMLRSWIYLDNHDTPRLATTLPGVHQRRLAQVLQFTLPGSPNLYYGSELDMPGGVDPEMRGPMRWDLVATDPPSLRWTKQLIALRRDHRALRIGNFRPLTTQRLFGFERWTDRAADTVLVLVNPGDEDVTETVLIANPKLMDATPLRDLLDPSQPPLGVWAALLRVSLQARSSRVLKVDVSPVGGYSNYKRVQ